MAVDRQGHGRPSLARQLIGRPRRSASRIETLTSLEQLERLRPEWDRLAADHPTPMSQADWVLAACATIDAGKVFHTLALRDMTGDLLGVAPLAVEGRGIGRRLVQIGTLTYEPPQFVFRDEDALQELMQGVVETKLPIFVRGAYADSPELRAFAATSRGIRPFHRGSSATAIKKFDGADLDSTIPGRRRSIVKRKRKAAEKIGPVEITFFSPTKEHVDAALDEFIEVEAAGWKGQAGTSLRQDLVLQGFYRLYARASAEHGIVRFGRVTIGGRTAAMRIDVERQGERWELKIGFNEDFSDVSPGQLLAYETFNDAIARGSRVHNFLGGHEPWQDDWGIEVRPLANIRWYPASLRGIAKLAADTAQFGARRIALRLKRK